MTMNAVMVIAHQVRRHVESAWLHVAMSLIIATIAQAQAINLDFGSYNAAPSVGYGAAPGQAGYWNHITGPDAQFLVDVAGQPTVVSVVSSSNTGWSFGWNDPNTTGDDELLLDGGHDGINTFTFNGLAQGIYAVYTYCWAADFPGWNSTEVSVPGSPDPPQLVGGIGTSGMWSGVHVQYESYAKHKIHVAGGQIQVVCTWGNSFATQNGIQIVPESCSGMLSYCTAKVNSSGCAPVISAMGVPSAGAGSGFMVRTHSLLNNKCGIYFYSKTGPAAAAFQGGVLCVQPPLVRTPLQNSGGSAPCGGSLSIDFNAYIATGKDPGLIAGQTVWIQTWSRDPGFAPPNNTNLSDAGAFVICP